MRSIIVFLSVFTIVLSVCFCLDLYAQQPPQQPPKPVRFEKLSENFYQVLDGRGAQGGVYIGDDAMLLVDSKMDSASVQQELDELKKLTNKPIRYVVHTHADMDHVRGNRYQPATATFVSQENCRKEFFLPGRNGSPSEWNAPGMLRFVPSVTFRDKMDIYLGSKKVELWYFGIGHTTGDAVVYFPEEKTAFIGDMVFLNRPPLIHAFKGGNSFEVVKSLGRMLDTLDAVRFCSGHSEPVDREGIKAYIAGMKERQEKIRGLLNLGKTVDEVKKEFAANESGLVEIISGEIKAGY